MMLCTSLQLLLVIHTASVRVLYEALSSVTLTVRSATDSTKQTTPANVNTLSELHHLNWLELYASQYGTTKHNRGNVM